MIKRLALVLFFSLIFSVASGFAGDWKENPVIYGVSEYDLAHGYSLKPLQAVRARLPEIHELGADVLWLLPVSTPSSGGEGYDVVDYFKVSPELGTDQDLKALVQDAHKLGMHVILDVPLNHTSIQHPFAQDVIQKGAASPYYGYYQHQPIPGIPYAQDFNVLTQGNGTFVYYFWNALVNFDYSNQQVRDYALSILEYWIKNFDVDGYRLDAAWGPSTRWPEFYSTVSRTLRAIKPDILLLAEDMAGYPAAYKKFSNQPQLKGSGFDLAYDWNNSDPNWISKWSFQLDGNPAHTVFNEADPAKAAQDFRTALSYTSDIQSGVRPLRFIEDNDTTGMTRTHTLAQAEFAGETMFLLPGVPLVFYGQEIANNHAIWHLPALDPAKKIRDMNPAVWDFYHQVITLRKGSKALAEGDFKLLPPKSGQDPVVVFTRTYQDETKTVELHFDTDTIVVK